MTPAEKIKAQNTIIDISTMLGLEVKADRGNKVICLCPFCEDKSGHLYLSGTPTAFIAIGAKNTAI